MLLVQVVKEERGNKGAALTTYLSLAGRYCVLMPNTSHGGGISRKISNGADRKRLKSIMSDLNLPKTMGLIVRTAGLSRTKTEIKRDFDYLARLWDEIRERTLGSTAPALIYRDSDLIKRAIRDLYHREIDEVIVEGEEGYKAARGFMKLLMPSHVRRVKLHSESTPLFQRYGVEDQLSAMYQPVVQLKSGGYLVINPTEALVSIDINSGRSTREHNIEQTAFATNLEAAAEIARQLRLRDMAGLIVIDFIDMEQNSHVRKVEKAMKDALKNDRARIQVGRISSFGLMEMSRQRLRTGVLEASTKPCPHCEGTGLMRTAASAGLSALRMIEDEAARGRGEKICLRAGTRSCRLRAQQEARRAGRYRAALWRVDRSRHRRELRRRADEWSKAPDRVRSPAPRAPSRRRSRKTIEEVDAMLDEDDEEEGEDEEAETGSDRGSEGEPATSTTANATGAGAAAAAVADAAVARDGEDEPRGEGEPADADDRRGRAARAAEAGSDAARRRRRQPAGAGKQEAAPARGAAAPRTQGRGAAAEESAEAMRRQLADGRAPGRRRAADRRDRARRGAAARKRRRRKKAAPAAEIAVTEPAPANAPPAETADQEAAPEPAAAKPARKRRSKACRSGSGCGRAGCCAGTAIGASGQQ